MTQGFCNGLVWVVIWMALVGYIIVVQDCMTPLMPAGTMLSQRRQLSQYVSTSCRSARFPSPDPCLTCGSPFLRRAPLLPPRSTWAVLGSAVVLPLSLTDLKFLSSTSTFSVGVNFYLFALLCVRLALDGVSPEGVCLIASVAPLPPGAWPTD